GNDLWGIGGRVAQEDVIGDDVDHAPGELIGGHDLPGVDFHGSAGGFGGGDVVLDRVFVFFNARGVGVFIGFVELCGAGGIVGVEHGDGFATGMFIQGGVRLEGCQHAGGLVVQQQVVLFSTGLLTQIGILGAR